MKSKLILMVAAAGLVSACSGGQETDNAIVGGEEEVNALRNAAVELQKAADNASSPYEANALQNQAEVVDSVASNQVEIIENVNTNAR